MSIVIIVSAPSGSGKSTLVRRLMEEDRNIRFSISYTTRRPRGAEKDGESYHYISRPEFESRIRNSEFLEWAEVFGNYYGTHRSYWDNAQRESADLLLDIDVKGARQLKGAIPDAVSIFILPPSRQVLEQRLRARSEDSEEVIERRLGEAAEEIRNYGRYDYVLINRDLEQSVRRLRAVVEAERLRRNRMESQIQPVLATFGSSLTVGARGE
jgi:guanylate kinase